MDKRTEGWFWVLTSVRAGSEARVTRWIASRGGRAYYPERTSYTKPRRKETPVARRGPAWPGYLFVQASTLPPGLLDGRCPGFDRFVVFDGGNGYTRVAYVPHDVIEMVQILERSGEIDEKPNLRLVAHGFKLGDYVRVIKGVFEDAEGGIVEVKHDTIKVKLQGWKHSVKFSPLLLALK